MKKQNKTRNNQQQQKKTKYTENENLTHSSKLDIDVNGTTMNQRGKFQEKQYQILSLMV